MPSVERVFELLRMQKADQLSRILITIPDSFHALMQKCGRALDRRDRLRNYPRWWSSQSPALSKNAFTRAPAAALA